MSEGKKPGQTETKVPDPNKVTTNDKPTITGHSKGTDTIFLSDVISYYKPRLEVANNDPEWEASLRDAKNQLTKLSNPKIAGRETPANFSLALTELAGVMASSNPTIESNSTGYEDLDKENEKLYLGTKKIFIDSCRKIYPDTKGDTENWERVSKKLTTAYPEFGPSVEYYSEILKQGDTKKIASTIDEALYFLGDRAKTRGYIALELSIKDASSIDMAMEEEKLASAAEAIYCLQLMREGLQKDAYGRKDTSPQDAKRIDSVRDGINTRHDNLAGRKEELDKIWERSEKNQAAKRKEPFDITGKTGALKEFMSAQGLDELGKVWTNEVKKSFLNYILTQIDNTIEQAKTYKTKNPNSILGKWNLALVVGLESQTGAYQRAFAAATKNIIDPHAIAGMSITKYLQEVFGYDLSNDSKRATDLNNYTNMLWQSATKP